MDRNYVELVKAVQRSLAYKRGSKGEPSHQLNASDLGLVVMLEKLGFRTDLSLDEIDAQVFPSECETSADCNEECCCCDR